MKTLTHILFAACALTLAACDEPVDLDAPEALELTPEQLDELEVALDAHQIELGEDPETPAPTLDIDMNEAEPSNEYYGCDAQMIAEYCNMPSFPAPYAGQCVSPNYSLIPDFCILVGVEFGACEYMGFACNQV